MIADASPYALAAAMIGRPLAMSAEAAASAFDLLSAMDLRAVGAAERGGPAKPYDVKDGIATIRIHDQLVSRSGWLSDYLGLSAYNRVRDALAMAGDDAVVRGVVLEFDSPGGDVAGATETAAAVRALSARKPVVSFVDSMAASAAYVIAAGAPRIVITPSATVGSIGVVYLHLDRSAALAKSGVKPTLLHAGKFKVDGNQYSALPDDARKRLQTMISQAHDLIVGSVGLHRPVLGEAGARKTEAGLYMGRQAVAAGLADRLGTMADAIGLAKSQASPAAAAMGAPLAARPTSPKTDRTMTQSSPSPALASPAPPPVAPAHKLTSAEQGRLAFAQAAGKSPTPMSAEMAAGQAAFAAAAGKRAAA